MMIPFQSDTRIYKLELPETAAPEVVFIGSHCNFSGCLISTTVQELGGVTSAMLTSFQELRRMIRPGAALPGAVLLDEPAMRGLSGADRDFLLGLDGVKLGIAFLNLDFGIACHADPEIRRRAVSIFPLNVRLDVWLSIVRLVVHGGSYVCPEVISVAPAPPAAPAAAAAPADSLSDDGLLTQRQADVLRLVAEGQSNKRIADLLGLSIHTVKLHLHNGSQRLGARNRTEAALRYRQLFR